jgi:hypothetical protein
MMRVLSAFAALIAGATPASAAPWAPRPASEAMLVRVADLDRAPVRKARGHTHRRHRHAPRYWAVVPITSGHPLHRFRGDIEYRYLPGTCCCCRGW